MRRIRRPAQQRCCQQLGKQGRDEGGARTSESRAGDSRARGAAGLVALFYLDLTSPAARGRGRPRAQWRRLDAGRLVPEAPEASPVLPQRRHESAAVPRGACTRRSTTRGRALQAPLQSAAP